MARLRYNGLKATLGGSLTSDATTVTFAAALTHSGGTAVPTIMAASDFIPLSILDGTGSLREVVYLTAYTAGATTGTISRGQEGTTAASHELGVTVAQAALSRDVTLPVMFQVPFRSQRWYDSQVSDAYSTLTPSVDSVHALPLWVPEDVWIDAMACEVTTAASGSTIRLGIYADANGVPGARLVHAGSVAGTTTGIKTLTGLSAMLPRGLVWLTFVANGAAPTMRSLATTGAANRRIIGASAGGDTSAVLLGWNIAGQSDLPSTLVGATLTTGTNRVRVEVRAT